MGNNLVKVEENSFINKIKNFFRKIFFKPKEEETNNEVVQENVEVETKESFLNDIKVDEQVKKDAELISLKQQYDNEQISEDDLTEEQIKGLIKLYDQQIEKLKKEVGDVAQGA